MPLPSKPCTRLTLGHSPDPDDAFMFWAIANNRIDTEGLSFQQILQDIQTLNEWADREELDITALSAHAYAFLADRYVLLPCGASMGDGYGPLVVSKYPMSIQRLSRVRIAVPGTLTSAFLALRLFIGDFEYEVVPFDLIPDQIAEGRFDAGLLIHEGQLTFTSRGLKKVVDLGEWWREHTKGLPLPLGMNAARRVLGQPILSRISRILRRSIVEGLAHREEAIQYAMQWGRGLHISMTDRFVGMYVNDLTLDLGKRGQMGLRRFLTEAHQRGYVPGLEPEFVSYET